MATIVTRSGKGSPLTNAEVDGNFTNLNTELGTKLDASSLAAVATSGAYSDLTGKPTNVSSFSNDSGYITGITSSNVTTALGFTPYNATNPAGYITSAGSISGNAATATNISNTGTVTLASATESNSIYATAPSYGADQPTKLLNFDWYSNVFSLGNIRSTSTDSNGFGVYYTATGGSRAELARFLPNGNFGIGTVTAPERLTIAGNIRIGNAGEPNVYNMNIVGRSPAAGTIDWDFKTNDATYGARTPMTISATGSVVANFDVRAPIFYDSNNTGYYVDAASNSALYQLTTGVGINLNGGIALVASGATLANSIGARLTESYGPVWNLGDGATWHHQVINGSMLCGFSALGTNWGSGNIIANGYLRGTLFYDQSDTAYYVDPNSLSNLVTIHATKTAANNTPSIQVRGGYAGYPRIQTYGLDNDPNAWMGLGTDMAGGPYEHSIYFPNGSFGTQGNGRLSIGDYNGTTYNPRLWVYPTYTQINNSTRSPLFYDSDNTGYYVDPNGVTRINKLTAGERSLVGYSTISMSGLDANTWYPVTIPVPVARQTTLRIENGLNSNVPSWSTHPNGFSCYFEWTTNGSGWGVIGISRRITDWREDYTSVQIVGGIAQMTFSSQEVIWLRGGANYYFSADCDVTPTVRTSSYEAYGQTVAPRSTVFNDPWATAVGKISYGTFQANERVTAATDIRAPIFYDSNDTARYVDPNSASVLASLTIASAFDTRTNDIYADMRVIRSGGGDGMFIGYANSSNGVTKIYGGGAVDGALEKHATYSLEPNSFRAPIFYDSANTAYYVDPNGTSQVSGANFNFGATGRVYDDGNFHIDGLNSPVWINSIGNSTIELNTQTSGYVNIGNSARAPIYYDSANTAYYIDPASTSNLVGLTVANTITGSINGTAAKATDLNQARYVNNDFNTLGTSPQVFRAYTNYIPSGGSYNQPPNGSGDYKVLQWGDVEGGTSGNWGGQIVQNFYDDRMWFRRSYGTTWQAWREFIHDGNYTNYAMPSGSSATNSVDVRAPIFYDSNNTGYYVNGDGVSQLYTLQIASGFGSFDSNNDPYGKVSVSRNTDANYAYYGLTRIGQMVYQMGIDTSNHFWIGGGSGGYNGVRGDTYLSFSTIGDVTAKGDFRAPIFYKSTNTAYYLNPYGTSNVEMTCTGSWYFKSNRDTSSNGAPLQAYSDGSTGATMAFHRAGVYAVNMGLDSDNVFRIGGWSAANGLIQLDMSGNFTALTSSRAPIFYDSNNTGYYVDPAGNSQLNTVSLGAGSKLHLVSIADPNHFLRYAGTGFSGVITDGPQLAGHQGGELATNMGGDNWSLRWDASGNTFSRASSRAPIFYDSDNTGYYINPNGSSLLLNLGLNGGLNVAGAITVGGGDIASYIYMADSDEGQRIIHCNSNRVGFLTQAGGWGSWCEDDGSWRTDTYFQAPIYYDINNSGYYGDFASTSVLFNLTISGGGNKYLQIQSTDSGEAMVRYMGATGPSWYVGKRTTSQLVDTASFHFYSESAGATVGGIDVSGNMFASGSMRAPIFYDSNDTAFYLDPNGTSILQTVSLGLQTWRGDITWNNAVNILVPASAECSFDVATSGVWQVWDSTTGAPMIRAPAGSNVQIGEAGSRGLYVYGGITATGNVTAYSDIRIKANIETIPSALDKLDQIRGVTYTRTDLDDKEQRYAGVIAQEIEAVLPEAVRDLGDIKAVDYNATIALLIQAVKELRDEVEMLRK